jgi:hypothetical protein
MLRVRFLLCCRRQRARCFTGMGSDETALSERPSRDTTDPWFGRSDGKAMPSLAAINADEAIAALDARTAAGFHVNYRPGGEPYFYLAVASRSPADIPVNPSAGGDSSISINSARALATTNHQLQVADIREECGSCPTPPVNTPVRRSPTAGARRIRQDRIRPVTSKIRHIVIMLCSSRFHVAATWRADDVPPSTESRRHPERENVVAVFTVARSTSLHRAFSRAETRAGARSFRGCAVVVRLVGRLHRLQD